VAAAPLTEFVGVTLNTIEVEVTDVTEAVNDVPSTAETNATVAPVANPLPESVTTVGPVASQRVDGLSELTTGEASSVMAPAVGVAWAPPRSVMDKLHVSATPPADVKSAVAEVVEVSATLLNPIVSVPQTAVSDVLPPLLMKFVPVMIAVPVTFAPVLLAAAP
jgi:hypothetical protein